MISSSSFLRKDKKTALQTQKKLRVPSLFVYKKCFTHKLFSSNQYKHTKLSSNMIIFEKYGILETSITFSWVQCYHNRIVEK